MNHDEFYSSISYNNPLIVVFFKFFPFLGKKSVNICTNKKVININDI